MSKSEDNIKGVNLQMKKVKGKGNVYHEEWTITDGAGNIMPVMDINISAAVGEPTVCTMTVPVDSLDVQIDDSFIPVTEKTYENTTGDDGD